MNIMFNDHYGLTAAVLDGIKTKTRRLVPAIPPYMLDGKAYACESLKMVSPVMCEKVMGYFGSKVGWQLLPQKCQPRYKLGVLYGVAQSYQSIYEDESLKEWRVSKKMYCRVEIDSAGWKNKMFVCDDLMPYQIKITNIRVERLRDISSADCLAEGVLRASLGYYIDGLKVKDWAKEAHRETDHGCMKLYHTPRLAYAALIDKISGKGTWERNPWVYAYDFKIKTIKKCAEI